MVTLEENVDSHVDMFICPLRSKCGKSEGSLTGDLQRKVGDNFLSGTSCPYLALTESDFKMQDKKLITY